MAIDEIDIYALLERVQKMEHLDVSSRLEGIERQLKYLSFACGGIDKNFKHGIQVSINPEINHILRPFKEDFGLLINPIRNVLNEMKGEVQALREFRKEIHTDLKNDSVAGTLKFMAKAIHELQYAVNKINEEGIKKNIRLDLTMDGYEMVKRKGPKIDLENDIKEEINEELATVALLDTLSIIEKSVLCHRYGLLGEKRKTLKATGKCVNLSPERIRQIESRALRKSRHPCRSDLSKNLTHLDLRNAILGE